LSLKFTPPTNSARYGLHVEGREFRTYNSLAIAKQAWYNRTWRGGRAAKIVELINGEWFVLYNIPKMEGHQDRRPPWVTNPYPDYSWGKYAARPMTNDEYAEFRLKVQLEQLAAQGKLVAFGSFNTVSVPNYASTSVVTGGHGIVAHPPAHVMANGRPVPGSGIDHTPDDDLTGPNWQGGTR